MHVREIIDNEAAEEELPWNEQQDPQLHLKCQKLESIKTVWLTIDNRLTFNKHIKNSS